MKKLLFLSFLFLLFTNCSTNKYISSTNEIKTLSNIKTLELNKYLKNIDSNLLPNRKTIIIYINNDPKFVEKNYQVPWDIFYGNLVQELNSVEKPNLFWIINENVKNLHFYHGDKINWKIDKENYLQNNFFIHNGMNGGFLILNKEGKYFFKEGEYDKKELINAYKSLN